MNKVLLTTCSIVLLLTIISCRLIQPPTPISSPISTNIPTQPSSEPAPAPAERIPVIFDDDGSPD